MVCLDKDEINTIIEKGQLQSNREFMLDLDEEKRQIRVLLGLEENAEEKSNIVMTNFDEECTSIKQNSDVTQLQTHDNNTLLTIEDVERKISQLIDQKSLTNKKDIKAMKKKLKNKMKKNKLKVKKTHQT